jgi:5-methylcytosine-specific restriction endonuclease McrA
MPLRVPRYKAPRIKTFSRGEQRPNAAARGYCDAQHRAWRAAVLLADGFICRACGRVCGQKGEAHADHKIPVKVRPDLRYEVSNGQCLCASCHQRKTNAETRM